jgi:CubicO group peptidase (beta-lactamase class C family)
MRPLPILAGLAALAVLIASSWAVTVRTDTGQDEAEAASGPVVRARPPVMVVEDLPQLKASLDDLATRDRFTGAVLVARGDQVLFRQVYGLADREAGRPFELDTPLRLASGPPASGPEWPTWAPRPSMSGSEPSWCGGPKGRP